jgi:hypothetical protein
MWGLSTFPYITAKDAKNSTFHYFTSVRRLMIMVAMILSVCVVDVVETVQSWKQ